MSSPAATSGVPGIMAQLVKQQSMAEIASQLAGIDDKVGNALQKIDDAEVAQLVGIGESQSW